MCIFIVCMFFASLASEPGLVQTPIRYSVRCLRCRSSCLGRLVGESRWMSLISAAAVVDLTLYTEVPRPSLNSGMRSWCSLGSPSHGASLSAWFVIFLLVPMRCHGVKMLCLADAWRGFGYGRGDFWKLFSCGRYGTALWIVGIFAVTAL
jgi:hypothetical protein